VTLLVTEIRVADLANRMVTQFALTESVAVETGRRPASNAPLPASAPVATFADNPQSACSRMEELVTASPVASRPHAEGYGIQQDEDSLMPWTDAETKVAASRNYWICTARPDGRPHAMPVWGVWHDGALYFGTGDATVKARNLAANPAVVVHLESGDDCVIIEGVAERGFPNDLAGPLNDAYRAKYGLGITEADEDAPIFCVRPRVAFAWLETDFPNTATRWRWQ
jgi:hypothetical protein